MEGVFVARPSAWRLFGLLAICLVFVLLGLWIAGFFGEAPKPNRIWIGWMSIVFFGGGALAVLFRLRDRRDQIIVDREGLMWRQWSDTKIPWGAIARIERRSIQRQPFLCLHLRDPKAYRSSRLMGRLAVLNRAMGFGHISVTTSGTDRTLDELEDALVREYQCWLDGQGAQPD